MLKYRKIVILSFLFFQLILFYSCAVIPKEHKISEPIKINVIVIPSRNYASMQPQIYYAFMDAGKKVDPSIKMKFVLFNPFQHALSEEGPKFQNELIMFENLLNESVPEVVDIKKANPETGNILSNIHAYIINNPRSHLAVLHHEIAGLMKDFDFLVIESSDTYGVHPIFYAPDVVQVDTPDGANAKDILEALYGFFFIDAAFDQHKPIWGTCHGSHVGYVHAGGRLTRLFDYKEGDYDLDFKKPAFETEDVEDWHIGKWLYTHKKNTDYREYGLIVSPVPEIFKSKKDQGKKMYMNKDLEHSLAMTPPIPKDIEVISYHPLSEYQDNFPDDFKGLNHEFSKILINQVIIDAYNYKTMLGTQFHPQFTYNDLDTSVLFEYLIRQVLDYRNIRQNKAE